MQNETYTEAISYGCRANQRRRSVHRYRIPAWNDSVPDKPISNHPFSGMLIAATAKALLPALRRSIRSKYNSHVGAKHREKMLGIYRSNLSELG